MSEVGGQHRQEALGILVGLIPAHERVGREAMPHVMQTRPMTVGRTAQADLPRQGIERSVNFAGIQTIAPARDEQIGRHWSVSPMAASTDEVPVEHLAGGRMQRDETFLAELGPADRQDCGPEVDISKLEIERLAQP